MRIVATPCLAKDLRPGDLFSTHGPGYWGNVDRINPGAVGERVYLRRNDPTPVDQADEPIFRIEIVADADLQAARG